MTGQQRHAHWIAASGAAGGTGDPAAIFPYWSFTKTAIAACALKLVETGMLDLDRRLAGRPYSLRQLLNHSAGLPDYGSLPAYHEAVARRDPAWPRRTVVDRAMKTGRLFQPGQGWSYSNIGYLRLRELIEDRTGRPLGQVIHETICAPLDLATVEFWDKMAQSRTLHWKAAEDYEPDWVYHGCLIGSAADAARLLRALFAGDVLGPEMMRAMSKGWPLGGAIPGRPWISHGYGLGLMSGRMDGAGQAIGHSGSCPFSANAVYHFPDLPNPVTVACFTEGKDKSAAECAAARIARDGDGVNRMAAGSRPGPSAPLSPPSPRG